MIEGIQNNTINPSIHRHILLIERKQMNALSFLSRRDDEKALVALEKAMTTALPNEDVAGAMATLRRRPLLRWFVLRSVRNEITESNISTQGQIDWEAIGDFLTKIAPIIFEIIKIFM